MSERVSPDRRNLRVRIKGVTHYETTWACMKTFTSTRISSTDDELWFVEHHPVYTLGQAGKARHIIDSGTIPVVRSDRGGQITYHGPGQLIAYVLIDIRRMGIGVRELVTRMEQSVIELLAGAGVGSARCAGAPGVYVDRRKIAALGLRIKHGRSYHGMALNVAMDLAPFGGIDPCGYPGLAVTQLSELDAGWTMDRCRYEWARELGQQLEMNVVFTADAGAGHAVAASGV